MKDSQIVLAIVLAQFNHDITDVMLASAHDEAKKMDISVSHVVKVPGSYEIPLMANELLKNPRVSAVVVLGYIERGETQHGEVMGHTVHSCLLRSSLEHRKPVGLGIIGPGAVVQQAEARRDPYARAAVRAAVAACRKLSEIENSI